MSASHRAGVIRGAGAFLLRAAVLLALIAASARAQVELLLDTVVLRWPMVDLRLRAECRRAPAIDLERRYFRLWENGREVTNFTLSCPDSMTFCPMSAALVFDVSGSMQGLPLQEAKIAGNSFVDRMMPGVDEATILEFSWMTQVLAPMTRNKAALHAAIDSMRAQGITAAWDAALAALLEVSSNAVNPCRAVVLLTDGTDNASTATPDDVIDSSLACGIPIYTIALGTFGSGPDLERIARETGGRFYNVEGPSGLDDIYVIIANVIKYGAAFCTISYTGACIDGGARSIEAALTGYCDGGDTASISFTAPDNTGRILPVDIAAGSALARGGGTTFVPLTLRTPLAGELVFPFELRLRYDTSLLRLAWTAPAPGSWLTTPPDLERVADGALLRTRQTYAATGAGDFLTLAFDAVNPPDTACTPLALDHLWFSEGCMDARLADGRVCITPCHLAPVVTVPPPGVLCPGASLLLATGSGPYGYAWTRNDTAVAGGASTLVATAPGRYAVTITDSLGCRAVSPPVDIPAEPGLTLRIGSRASLPAQPGALVRVPLALAPPLHPGQPLAVTQRVDFDPALLAWDGLEENPAAPWMARRDVTPSAGSVRLDCDGYLADTLRELYTLRFRVTGAPHAPVVTAIRIGAGLAVGARCLESLATEDPSIVVDGSCVGLVRRPVPTLALAAWPNPLRDAAEVAVTLPAEGHATLKAVNVLGRQVALLADGVLPAGRSSFRFSASGLPAGEYRLVLLAGGELRSKALQVVK